MNVYLILWESGKIQAGQDLRQTPLFQRSLQLGLVSQNSSPETSQQPGNHNQSSAGQSDEFSLHVGGMWCTSCAWLIEHALAALPGIIDVQVSFASDLAKIHYQPRTISRERILARIHSLGYIPQEALADSDSNKAETRDLLIRTGLAAFLWANIMSFSLALYTGYFEQISGSVRRGLPFVLMILATPVVFYCASPILRLAGLGLWNRTIRMEVLLALGILAGYGYSAIQAFRGEIHLYFDTASIIVTLVLAGKLIERGAKQKTSQWVAALHRMTPNKVRLLAKDSERFVSVDALQQGQVFVVKAGEHIPADGVIVIGESHADESLLSGESTPVRKRPQDRVAAGSINLDGVLQIEATKSARESTISRIIAQVEQALSSRCELERAVDRVSRVFVPCIILIAGLTFFYGWALASQSLSQALMRSVTVLVIACPCALGLATPLAITSAFGVASRRGILVRDSRVLETLRKIDTVILDKTGTVTQGKFALIEMIDISKAVCSLVLCGSDGTETPGPPVSDAHLRSVSAPDSFVLPLLAAIEQYSEHPVGMAVLEFARRENMPIPRADSIEIHKGIGIVGITGGKKVFAGNRRLLDQLGIFPSDFILQQANECEAQGKTVVFVGWDGALQSLAVFGDTLKPEAWTLIAELKRRGIEVRLLSGDSHVTTKWIAEQLQVDFCAEVLPEEKAGVVSHLRQRGSVVAVVGDGINDAPALAEADLGIAMGSGADIAMKAAAIVLMSGSLPKVLDVFDLSQKTIRIIHQNLFWAFFYNAFGISLAVAGVLNPIMAAVAMLFSSISVVANSMRLTRELA